MPAIAYFTETGLHALIRNPAAVRSWPAQADAGLRWHHHGFRYRCGHRLFALPVCTLEMSGMPASHLSLVSGNGEVRILDRHPPLDSGSQAPSFALCASGDGQGRQEDFETVGQ
jgi:hypothetical protein